MSNSSAGKTKPNKASGFVVFTRFCGVNTACTMASSAEHRARKETYALSPHTVTLSSLLSPPDFRSSLLKPPFCCLFRATSLHLCYEPSQNVLVRMMCIRGAPPYLPRGKLLIVIRPVKVMGCGIRERCPSSSSVVPAHSKDSFQPDGQQWSHGEKWLGCR